MVVPGGGINERNVKRILEGSGAVEFHCSARKARASAMEYCRTGVSMGGKFDPSEFSIKEAHEERVRSLVSSAEEVWKERKKC